MRIRKIQYSIIYYVFVFWFQVSEKSVNLKFRHHDECIQKQSYYNTFNLMMGEERDNTFTYWINEYDANVKCGGF